jgi:hypothetical protein
MVIKDAVVFDCILLIGFIVMAVVSINYNARARSIPMALGIIGAIMMVFQLLVDMFPRLKMTFRFVGESGILAGQDRAPKADDEGRTQSEPGPEAITHKKKNQKDAREWLKVLRLIAWISAFIMLLGMTHYLIAVGLFVIFVTRIEARESWARAVVLAACVNAGFFVLFNLILKAQL